MEMELFDFMETLTLPNVYHLPRCTRYERKQFKNHLVVHFTRFDNNYNTPNNYKNNLN